MLRQTLVVQLAVASPTKSSNKYGGHIRLILALRREEPGCNGGQDNDDEADEYAPAKQSKQSAAIITQGFEPHSEQLLYIQHTCLPSWLFD